MNKTFNDLLDETVNTTEATVDVEENTDVEADQTEEIETTDEDTTITEENNNTDEEETGVESEEITKDEKPDFKAFAEMRTKAKQLQTEKEVLEVERQKFEKLAQTLKYKDAEEMLSAAELKDLEIEAEKQNVPVEFLKRLNDLEAKDKKREADLLAKEMELKETILINNIDTFANKNSLQEKDVTDIITKLSVDGFDYDMLINLPDKSVEKLLNSYLDKETLKQKEIETKAKMKKEIPLTPTDKPLGDIDKLNEELFNSFMGKNRDY